ncbi:MAG: DNA-binding response regulator, partial [Bacteroidetes bacterium HGW-Bacteroidetes-23]
MTTAILIDDDANLRAGMRQMLSRYAPDISIIGEADSVQSGVETIHRLKPQVLFLDI